MRVAALTQGRDIPSARFRIRQLVQPLAASGITLDEFPSSPGAYPPPGGAARLSWGFRAMGDAAARVTRSRRYDATIIQRELISTLPSFERWAGHPVIADIDDAIWLYRRGRAAANLASAADHIVVGNSFLAQHFEPSGKPITVIPTGVDARRFVPRPRDPDAPKIIGWSGTWGGYAYFEPLQLALAKLLKRHPDWRLRFISDRPPNSLNRLPQDQVEYRPWSPDTEAALSADMDIGLMPLDDSLWSLGKCSYKMLLYMACGVPVVASDLGMNAELLRMDAIGLGARTPDDWHDALDQLMADPAERSSAGLRGRHLVERQFSLDVVSRQWQAVLAPLAPQTPRPGT